MPTDRKSMYLAVQKKYGIIFHKLVTFNTEEKNLYGYQKSQQQARQKNRTKLSININH